MMNKLTEAQLRWLRGIKHDGEYPTWVTGERRVRIPQESLYITLYFYLRLRNVTRFKSKYLRKDRKRYMKNRSMYDCPLCRGELINAIKYGVSNGFLVKSGSRSNLNWTLSNKVMMIEEGMQNHGEINTRDEPLRDLR